MNVKSVIKSALLHCPAATLPRSLRYDKETILLFSQVLGPTSNCVDVGCHKGTLLKEMIRYASAGQHFGFEPIPEFADKLKEDFPEHKIYQLGLDDIRGECSFNHVTTNPAYSGIKKRTYVRPDEKINKITIQVDMLDNIIPHDLKIDLIKIDVEGGELGVLRGGRATIKRCQPFIIFEHGKGAAEYYNTTPSMVFDLLNKECGLQLTTMALWLKRKGALSRASFIERFNNGTDYYFMACPSSSL